MEEKRTLKVMFNKSGGTSRGNSYSPKISIPKAWLDDMGITLDKRYVDVIYDEKKIVISKKEDD